MSKQLIVLEHPLVDHLMCELRHLDTAPRNFRNLVTELAVLVAYEASRSLPAEEREVPTPLGPCRSRTLQQEPVIVPILRAGLGMVTGLSRLFPDAPVGHLGMYRNEETFKPVPYYAKLPGDLARRPVFLVDPMLATGGSALMALEYLTEQGARDIRFLCLVAAPEGVKRVHEQYPDVTIWTAALDEGLNERAYIVPGLGDAGDRMFGTD